MATRGTISIVTERTKEGVGRTIYTHWDSYPSHNGRILLEHYNTPERVNALIDLGAISSLAPNIAPEEEGVLKKWNSAKGEYDSIVTKEPHTFDNPHHGVVIAYHRDRGEDLQIDKFNGKPSLKNDEEFNYLFVESENQWYVRTGKNFIKLTERMCS
jgi:hypothetical protein